MTARLFALAIICAVARPACAQEPAPAVEVFGGYSLLPANVLYDFPRRTSHGVQGSVAVNLTRSFGIVADAGAQWNTTSDLGPNFAGLTAKTTVWELLVGPRFTRRSRRVDGFVDGWFGTAIGRTNEDFRGFADHGVTFGGGAGVDVRVGAATAIRVQYDLVGSFADIVEGNSRLGAGLVYRIGRRG
jgi:hypothetical protein